MALRPRIVWLHRWLGLTTALFLVITGLTGSLLAFEEELDAWLAPWLHHAPAPRPGAPLLEPLPLRDAVARQLGPKVQVTSVTLDIRPGEAVVLRARAAPGQPALAYDEVRASPYTGEVLGTRATRGIHWGREHVMPFLFQLHSVFALPTPYGQLLMGVVAVLWTIDCFIGGWVTLPTSRHPGQRGWWKVWKTAWTLKREAGTYRRNLDLHRAGGLWLWAVLFLFAWSSVMFNLRPYIWQPVMSLAFDFDDRWRNLPDRPASKAPPQLDWPAALDASRRAMAGLAADYRLRLDHEQQLSYNPGQRLYMYMVHSSADFRPRIGNTAVLIDADTGELLAPYLPTGSATGNTVGNWMGALHMAHVWGLPYKIFVAVLGVVVTVLTGTGVYIWWKKRRARALSGLQTRAKTGPRRAPGAPTGPQVRDAA